MRARSARRSGPAGPSKRLQGLPGVGCGLERLLQKAADERHVRGCFAGVVESAGEAFTDALLLSNRLGQQHDRVVDGQRDPHRADDHDHGDQVREDLAVPPRWVWA
ncbi:hypothetical protein [Streptomyces sp. NPDC059918]|uniref:hypothetical protein n=1 Tax=unclassified Streptomyces TaxID=2593676 RepID=UPI00364EA0D4